MKTRRLLLFVGLGFGILLAIAFLVGNGEEPTYQGQPLNFWVTKLGSDEFHGAPKDAITAIRAIGPKAVPFLLEWMPRDHPHSHNLWQPGGPVWVSRSWFWFTEYLAKIVKRKEKKNPDSL